MAAGTFAPGKANALTHSKDAMNLGVQMTDGRATPSDADRDQCGYTLRTALDLIPADDQTFLPDFEDSMRMAAMRALPSPERPLKASSVLPRLYIGHLNRQFMTMDPKDLLPNPAASMFPGEVDGGSSTAATIVRIQTGGPGVQCLGMYATPAHNVGVEMPPTATEYGLKIRIGSHPDELWNAVEWKRFPYVVREFALTASSNTVASAFGGLLYAIVPEKLAPTTMVMRITGAVRAPYFDLAHPTAWQSAAGNPGRWGELAAPRVAVTVPASALREVPDAAAVLRGLDLQLAWQADLFGTTLSTTKPIRIVYDIQTATGASHAGDPVVITGLSPAALVNMRSWPTGCWDTVALVGADYARSAGAPEEMAAAFGHLSVAYACEKGYQRQMDNMRKEFTPAERKMAIAGFTTGADATKWQTDPLTASLSLVYIQKQFGWDPIKAAIQQARAIPADRRPTQPEQRRDLWIVLLSKSCGRNLAPYFKIWGLEASEKANSTLMGLAKWLPPEVENIGKEDPLKGVL